MSKFADTAASSAFKTFRMLFSLLPRPVCLAAGRGLGLLAFRLDRRHRRIALENLAVAFGRERSEAARAEIARASFKNLGGLFGDILKLLRYSRKRALSLIAVEGRAHMEAALAQGKGVLLFTGHFGNWELAAAPLTEIGPLRVVARALDNPLLEKELAALRTKLGGRIIDKFGAARPILKALGRNEIVAILIDQNVLRREAVFVDFFGKTAGTTPGLAAFHLRTGAPLVPIFVHPDRRGRYVLKIGEPFTVPASGRLDDDVLKITQLCTKIIEREIRESPELWFWVHKRWNTRPADEVTSP